MLRQLPLTLMKNVFLGTSDADNLDKKQGPGREIPKKFGD
jgi:hypothetical protein